MLIRRAASEKSFPRKHLHGLTLRLLFPRRAAVNLPKFLAELRRRNVYRAAVGYVAAAWVLIQVVTQVFPFFDVSSWAVRTIIVLLVAGFPVALILAWAFELTPEGLVRTEDVPLQPIQRRRAFGRKLDFAIIAVLTLAVALLLFDRFRPRAPHEKSIAVLPFENLSEDKANAFFADGLQEDLLTNLARIKDLRVISRTSVKAYKGTEGQRDLREIAGALGVVNILEGSVRRSGDRVVVNAQLIDTRRGRHLWANRYNRTLADSLGIEGELASKIAEALRVTLTADEKERVVRQPTDNAEAYDLYLRALPYEQGPDTLLQDYRRAEELYRRAIALDPEFALAHARLASTAAAIFHFHEPLDQWRELAEKEAALALELQPNLGEAHFARAQCLYWMHQDYDKALGELALAQQLLPNDTSIGVLVAAILRRQGQFERALAAYESIEKLDPRNPNNVRNLMFTNTALRRWAGAAKAAERLRRLAPESIVAVIQSAYIQFWWKGEIGSLQREANAIPAGIDPDGVVTSARWEAQMLQRNFAGATKVIDATALGEISYANGSLTPVSFFRGCIALARGDTAAAAGPLEEARIFFQKAVEEAPEVAARHANLGMVQAFLGRHDEAIRSGRRAVELKPLSKDAFDGALMLCSLALIYARVGENEHALDLLEQLIDMPGAVDSVDYSVTVSDLKFRWEWDELRSHPRFAKLLARPEN